jgi:predicted nucleic acid-binding protein
MTILDTDTVTLYAMGHEKVGAKVDEVGGPPQVAVAVIPRMEILRSRFDNILKAADEAQLNTAMQRLQQAQALLDSFLTLPVDRTAAQRFTALRTHKKARKMRRADMLIACTALAHDALQVTRKVKDYKDVPRLRVENWAD